MSEANVEVVRTIYEAFARGDFSVVDSFSDDFVFVTSPELPDAGEYRGEQAIGFIKAWVETFGDLRMEATEILEAVDDKVFVELLQRGAPSGTDTVVEGRWWQVATLREGEVVRAETFAERTEALEVAGF
ncbi:MAG TPA: nuclear transport factor 2 family protein [Thermoleophilaceae bacterium]